MSKQNLDPRLLSGVVTSSRFSSFATGTDWADMTHFAECYDGGVRLRQWGVNPAAAARNLLEIIMLIESVGDDSGKQVAAYQPAMS